MKTIKISGVFVVFLFLLIGAVIWFFSVAEEFYAYQTATVEAARAVTPHTKEHALARLNSEAPSYDTEVKYRKFFITAPGANQVELRGDFNRWGQDPILLTAYNKGYFETSVALASGEYKYEFVVDGQARPDPSNQDRQQLSDGREVCIKTVR